MASSNTYKTPPPIVWLRITDYMHDWMQYELGCAWRVSEQRVVCVQHLPGAREVLRMETVEDMMERQPVGLSLSATRKNCIDAGLQIDEDVMKSSFGITREEIQLFVPIECPKMCLTQGGVLRPWTHDRNMSRKQAAAMQRILRDAFWQAVADYNDEYAEQRNGLPYPAIEMIEDFCAETKTSDVHVPAIRREWQRRRKRMRGEG